MPSLSSNGADLGVLLSPVIEALGLELWGWEFQPSERHALLRIYIDEQARGVTLDDCEAVSHEVSALLDVHDPIAGQYTLEVSSPGLDRPLYALEHFARFVGEAAKITLHAPRDGRRRFHGVILGVEGEDIQLEQDGEPVVLPFAAIRTARLAPVFEAPAKPGHKPGGAGKKKRGG